MRFNTIALSAFIDNVCFKFRPNFFYNSYKYFILHQLLQSTNDKSIVGPRVRFKLKQILHQK